MAQLSRPRTAAHSAIPNHLLLVSRTPTKEQMAKRASPRANPLWTCLACRRRFAKRNQAHSCRVRGIADHFRGKEPRLRLLFDALRRALERSGPLRVDAVESTINLVSKHHFGGVRVRRGHLRVGFILDHEIHDKRISRAERVGPRRVSHHVLVRFPSDLDDQLLGWLADAQAMQGRSVAL